MLQRLTFGPWQRSAYLAVGVSFIVLGGLIGWASKSWDLSVALGMAFCGVAAVVLWAGAIRTRIDLTTEGFVWAGLGRLQMAWSDIERFYVYGTRGLELVGYVPTARYKSTHPFARFIAALNLGRYALPALGMDASRQASVMNDWLRRYGNGSSAGADVRGD